MLEKLIAPSSASKADLVERVRRIMLRQKPETVAADLLVMRDRPDSSDLLGQIDVPTLVVVGDQDVLTPPSDARTMADAIPGRASLRFTGRPLTPLRSAQGVSQALSEFFASLYRP